LPDPFEEVAGLAVEHAAHGFQGAEAHGLGPAAFQHGARRDRLSAGNPWPFAVRGDIRASTSGHPCGVIPPLGRRRKLYGMNGWLLWGLVLPVLLVVAGIVQFQRNKRR